MKYAGMLENRYAMILGADTSIGWAIAQLFAKHYAKVAVVAAPCVSHGAKVAASMSASESSQCDVYGDVNIRVFKSHMAPTEMAGLCAEVLSVFPYVDILVNATDYYPQTTPSTDPPVSSLKIPLQCSVGELREILDVNFNCAVRCFQELLPGMLERRRGEVILFAPSDAQSASVAARVCAGAITSFARNVTHDYIRYRVRANAAIYPSAGTANAEDDANDVNAVDDACAQDAANAALWYACDLSRFVLGENLKLRGGMPVI